jgi:hypothetical protein
MASKTFHYNNYRLRPSLFRNRLKVNRTTQYEIVDAQTLVSSDGMKFHCIISLRRMYMHHVTNTYLPTITLLIISGITLFFDEKNLQVSML